MLSLVKHRVLRLKRVAGIDLTISKEGEWSIKLCVLEKDNSNVIKITKKEVEINSFEALSKIVDNDTPIFVVVSGKGILHKTVLHKEVQDDDIVKETFPGAKLDDFHYQVDKFEESCLVSIARKDVLSEIISEIETKHLSVIDFSISPFVVKGLLNFLNSEVLSISTGKYEFEIRNHEIVGVKANSEKPAVHGATCFIGEEALEEIYLTAYAAALSLFISGEQNDIEGTISSLSRRGEWKQKRVFHNSLKLILCVIFLLLIANALLFFYYTTIQEQLVDQFSQKSTRLSYLNGLNEDLARRKNFLRSLGWLSKTHIAFFADRMAATIPDNLSLTSINFHPLNEKLSEEVKGQMFDSNLIYIEGKCSSPLILNEWLSEIKGLDWVKKINKQEYKYNDKHNVGFFKFEIELVK